MLNSVKTLAKAIAKKGLNLRINLERPIFIQPEDRISYRAYRILLILGRLNTKNGLSKEVVACIDFLLRNQGYQKKFLIEYFKGDLSKVNKILNQLPSISNVENDFHIIRYKSVPWDLRFNDMFIFLLVRGLITFKGKKPNCRVIITEKGTNILNTIQEIFEAEKIFLDHFGKRMVEQKTINIITDVIPNSYWIENEKFNY